MINYGREVEKTASGIGKQKRGRKERANGHKQAEMRWGLIKYAKKLLNYVFPQETDCCEILLKNKLALDFKKGFCFWCSFTITL